MIVRRQDTLPLRTEDDVVLVRQAVRSWARALGMTLVEETKVVTAASELARNTLVHGGGGTARLEAVEQDHRQGLRLVFEDKGPGIPDVALALTDGYSTVGGLGLGLGGARRLSSEFVIDSRPGEEGTRVTMLQWKLRWK